MVSLGSGDSELVTIKALKVLKQSDTICVPTKSINNSFKKSLTYKIVFSLMKEYNFNPKIVPIYTPMNFKKKDWEREVDIILGEFKTKNIVSFVTLGDASIYSTVYYLLDIIKKQNRKIYKNSEVIAGVTSFSQASARIKKPLCIGNSGLQIVPLVDGKIQNTIIYMRPKVGRDTKKIRQKNKIWTFENLNFNGEKIVNRKIKIVKKYMTLFIDFFNHKGYK